MNAARVRISRVRMKNGGADVTVLRRDAEKSVVVRHMRAWSDHVMSHERAPDAYAAVALWFDPEHPGRPAYNATWCTASDTMPAPLLARIAGAYLVTEVAVAHGVNQAIEAMGYEIEDWNPDDAA